MGWALSVSAVDADREPYFAIASSTSFLRSVAPAGFRNGSYVLGAWTNPARVAAWGTVRPEAGTP
jgi:hypothetical protein